MIPTQRVSVLIEISGRRRSPPASSCATLDDSEQACFDGAGGEELSIQGCTDSVDVGLISSPISPKRISLQCSLELAHFLLPRNLGQPPKTTRVCVDDILAQSRAREHCEEFRRNPTSVHASLLSAILRDAQPRRTCACLKCKSFDSRQFSIGPFCDRIYPCYVSSPPNTRLEGCNKCLCRSSHMCNGCTRDGCWILTTLEPTSACSCFNELTLVLNAMLLQPPSLLTKALTINDALATIPRALTALVYQQRSLLTARKFAHSFFLSREVDLRPLLKFRDPKMALSLTVSKFQRDRPISRFVRISLFIFRSSRPYRLLKETGRLSNAPVFVVGIYSGADQLGEGFGSSLKMAEYRVRIPLSAKKMQADRSTV